MSPFRQFVQQEIARRCARNPRYSLRAAARALVMDPATLSQLVRGKRRFTPRTIRRVGASFGLDPAAIEEYVRREAKPLRTLDELEKDLAALVDEWQHRAILELTSLDEFQPDSRWIARVLGTTADQVNVALQRLTRLGLLRMVSAEKWSANAPAPVQSAAPAEGLPAACPVVRWQVIAREPERLASFYAELFGWTIDAGNALGYREVRTGGTDGGIWPAPPEAPAFVQLFAEVPDVAQAFARARALGAEAIVPPQALPDGDVMAILKAPCGIPFGMMSASPR
jgi:predicted enzyme related to lactoylglutathione lyase